MLVRQAREVAAKWVREHASSRADFRGAFFSGSATALPEDGSLPAASDVDVLVVLAGSEPPPKPGKLVYDGVLLEVTYLASAALAEVGRVADSYHLAHCFSRDTIISDPTGHLHGLYRSISPTFGHPETVLRRCESAIAKIEAGLRALDMSAPWHDQVTAWMFPTSVTTHVVLVAARQNPTVRLRYLAARTVLRDHGFSHLYPQLLDLAGCRSATRDQVQHHLDTLATTFDAAAALARTPFFFSADITAAARSIAIDGSQDLITAGNHREAVFWIVASHARCQKILAADASAELRKELEPAFRTAVGDLLHVNDSADLLDRAVAVTSFLPTLRSAARAIAGQGQHADAEHTSAHRQPETGK